MYRPLRPELSGKGKDLLTHHNDIPTMRQGKDIINRYNTYLRLEKSLSANSIDAYLTDLDKLLRFAEDEKKDVKEISYDDLQQFDRPIT